MSNVDSLEGLLQDELKDIYDAEKQLTKALPKMIKTAAADDLKQAFQDHARQTEQHVKRLEDVFERLGMPARRKKCIGIQNLLKEGKVMIDDAEEDATRDAAMIASAQKIEHYEIASYGAVRTWANVLGKTDIAGILEETLVEEKAADQKLTDIAESSINASAAAAGEGAEEKEEEMTRRVRHVAADRKRH
jgi:ferritin-like metal-binding protein YciE